MYPEDVTDFDIGDECIPSDPDGLELEFLAPIRHLGMLGGPSETWEDPPAPPSFTRPHRKVPCQRSSPPSSVPSPQPAVVKEAPLEQRMDALEARQEQLAKTTEAALRGMSARVKKAENEPSPLWHLSWGQKFLLLILMFFCAPVVLLLFSAVVLHLVGAGN